jgi:hypothetical protein
MRGLDPRIHAPFWLSTRCMDCRVKPGNDEGGTVLGMTRERILYLILGALVVAVIVLGYQVYQDRKNTTGIDINIGERGISIEKK